MAKILLVEDDNNLREIYGARLSAEGHTIVAAGDGEEALAIAVKEKPDLIISDVMMPRISGFDMLDILRNAPETKDTKVIMMTALSQAEDKARADKLGADLYLVKSQVTLEDVAKSVRDILNASEGGEADSEAPTPPVTETAPEAPTTVPVAEPAKPEPVVSEAPILVSAAPEGPAAEVKSVEPAVQPTESSAPAPAPAPANDAPVAPATSDDPVTPVVVMPTPTDDSPVAATAEEKPAETPKPAATPIEVLLPDDEPKKSESSPTPAVETSLASDFVGPNLAEALADEEETSSPSAGKTEEAAGPIKINVSAEPETPVVAAEPPKEEKEESDSPSTYDDSNPKKKVIQPSEEFLKGGPNLDELVAKEEAMAASKNPTPSTVITPPATESDSTTKLESQNIPVAEKPPEDEASKIAL